MDLSDAQRIAQHEALTAPSMGADGVVTSAARLALADAIKSRSGSTVTELLRAMDLSTMVEALEGNGFRVPSDAKSAGRAAVYGAVRGELQGAVQRGLDGFAMQSERLSRPRAERPEVEPLQAVQVFFKGAASVGVELLGDAPLSQRPAMLMIAGQAQEAGILGFAFDGVAGKYELPSTLADVVALHRSAAVSVGVESSRAAFENWAQGNSVGPLGDLVPDSVQRLLQGSVTLASAQSIGAAIRDGAIAAHADFLGEGRVEGMLREQGIDPEAPTVGQVAGDLGLMLKEANRERGQYWGTVVGTDHRAFLVKVTRSEAIAVPFADAAVRPQLGDTFRLRFDQGRVSISSADRGRSSVER